MTVIGTEAITRSTLHVLSYDLAAAATPDVSYRYTSVKAGRHSAQMSAVYSRMISFSDADIIVTK